MVEQQQRSTPSIEKTPKPQPSHPPPEFSGGDAAWKAAGKYPNPPDPFNPDPVALRDQWRFAIRQYSKWYSHAWGTAIFAGLSFFALGWIIKGSNPLHPVPPQPENDHHPPPTSATAVDADR